MGKYAEFFPDTKYEIITKPLPNKAEVRIEIDFPNKLPSLARYTTSNISFSDRYNQYLADKRSICDARCIMLAELNRPFSLYLGVPIPYDTIAKFDCARFDCSISEAIRYYPVMHQHISLISGPIDAEHLRIMRATGMHGLPWCCGDGCSYRIKRVAKIGQKMMRDFSETNFGYFLFDLKYWYFRQQEDFAMTALRFGDYDLKTQTSLDRNGRLL